MKSEQLCLKRIIRAIEKIERYLQQKSQNDLESDGLLYDAVLMEIVVIGEEAMRVPEEIRKRSRNIAWHKIVGMRNRITHEYFHVDPKIIWDTYEKDFPVLKKQLKNILE